MKTKTTKAHSKILKCYYFYLSSFSPQQPKYMSFILSIKKKEKKSYRNLLLKFYSARQEISSLSVDWHESKEFRG